MAFTFDHDLTLSENTTQLVEEQLRRALVSLEEKPAHKAIFDARRRIKKVRALGRLVRYGLRKADWRDFDTGLRDGARAVSDSRDAAMLAGFLQSHAVHLETLPSDGFGNALTAALTGHFAPVLTVTEDVGEASQRLRDALHLAVNTPRHWRWKPRAEDAVLLDGLSHTHQRGARTVADAGVTDDPDIAHDLRKHAKTLRLQLRLVGSAAPELATEMDRVLAALARSLGFDRDLWLMTQTMTALSLPRKYRQEADELRIAWTRQSHQLRADALSLAGSVYGEPSDGFAARMLSQRDGRPAHLAARSRLLDAFAPARAARSEG